MLKMFRPLFSIAPMLKSRHGDDVEHIEIVFATKDLFVPLHRGDQEAHAHGRCGPRSPARDLDVERHLAAAGGGEAARDWPPDRPRPARTDSRAWARDRAIRPSACRRRSRPGLADCRSTAAPESVALSPCHPHAIGAEHIGAVGEEGDAAETLRPRIGCTASRPRHKAPSVGCCRRGGSRFRW